MTMPTLEDLARVYWAQKPLSHGSWDDLVKRKEVQSQKIVREVRAGVAAVLDALTARIAELERERDNWQAEMEEKISEAEEAAEQHRQWPAWAAGILKDLRKLGFEYDHSDEIDLRGDFVDHVNEWVRGIERQWKSRALAAEAALKTARREALTLHATVKLYDGPSNHPICEVGQPELEALFTCLREDATPRPTNPKRTPRHE